MKTCLPIRVGGLLACLGVIAAPTIGTASPLQHPVPSAPAGLTNQNLVGTASISGTTLSPDGRYVAFRVERPSIERNTEDLVWYVARIDGADAPRKIAEGGRSVWASSGVLETQTPQWSSDSKSIYFLALFDQQVQVWRASVSGNRAEQITSDAADVIRFRLSDDGAKLLHEVDGADRAEIIAAENAEYDAGIRIDETINVAQNLQRSVEINGRLASERLTGRWFSTTHILGERAERLKLLDLSSTRRDVIAAEDELNRKRIDGFPKIAANSEARSIARRKNGAEVAFLGRAGDEMELRWTPSATSSESRPCLFPECRNPVAVQWRGDRRELIFTTRENKGPESLSSWNIDQNSVRSVYKSAGTLGGDDLGGTCPVNDSMAICVVASGSEPPRLVAIDLDTGSRKLLFDPNQEVAGKLRIAAKWISWTTASGRTAWGQFLDPGLGRPAPLFISYYTCRGFMKGGTGDQWPFHVLAEAGIAVLCIQQTASSTRPDGTNDQVRAYELALEDVRSAIQTLSQRGLVDPQRVGMGGLSFGSEVTMWIATHSDLLAALSIASGQQEPGTYYYFNSLPGRDFKERLARSWELGAPDKTAARWKQISPALSAEQINAPLLMQLPEQEYQYNVRLYSELLNSGRAADFYVFPHERHIIAQPRHRLAIYDRNVDWFRFWLQGYEDPVPAKAEQYARWRKLRSGHTSR